MFFSHRPSALRKSRKILLFTPNISTGDGGVHRHQAIVPFLFYDTTTNHGVFNFTSPNDAILQLARLSAYTLGQYIALITCVVASRRFRLFNFWLPHLQLSLSMISYGVEGSVCLTMNFTAEQIFLWSCCLLLPLFYELDLSFYHLLVILFVLTKSSILTRHKNNAADRQMSMIIVITNKGCSQSLLLNPA